MGAHHLRGGRSLGWRAAVLSGAACAAWGCAHGRWLGAFEAYPGVRALCDEQVKGAGMEIHWLSFASTDPPQAVAAFYAPPGQAPSWPFELRTRDDNAVLHVQSAGEQAPSCGEGPGLDERTVIVVSRAAK